MLKKYIAVMDMCKFVIILILYFSCSSCYPTKPLNERSPDLTWEAWLLVDEQQNQNKQLTDGMIRRRITPKSIFIAPTFSPESLPACAEGYSSDHLGRCIKIIKLDQAAHYDFLIEKLKEKFGPDDYDDDYYDDSAPTPGPFQVNIPLGIQNDQTEDGIEESDVAIIVSPTKPQINAVVGKRDNLNNENEEEFDLKQLVEPSSTPTPTTTDKITTTGFTETMIDTTSVTEQATTTVTTDSTSTVEATTDSVMSTEAKTTSPKEDLFETVNSQSNLVRFPTDQPKMQPLNSYFRFPNDEVIIPSQTTSSTNHMPRAINVAESTSPEESDITFDLPNFRDSYVSATPQDDTNRRNRDRNNGLFMLPPRWSDSNYQRPVVLRFSRKHAYLDMEQFKKPNYYRSIPTDDFAYLFKFKHKQSNQR